MPDIHGRTIANLFAGEQAAPLRYIASGSEEMAVLERYESVSRRRLPRDARGGWSVPLDFWAKVLIEARRAIEDWKQIGLAAKQLAESQKQEKTR